MNGVIIKLLVYVDPMNDVHITAKVDQTIYRMRSQPRATAPAQERPLDI